MNKAEAKSILHSELDQFRTMSHEELTGMIGGKPYTSERTGDSGATYQIEIETFWEDQSRKKVRVVGSADESPHKPFFWKIPMLRWLPIYITAVTWTFVRDQNGTDEN